MSNNENTSSNSRFENITNYARDKTDKLATPMTVLLYFFFITIIYGFITINSIINSTSIDIIAENKNNVITDIIYVSILLIGTIYMNVKISKTICNTTNVNWGDIFLITFLPWLIIFGLIYLLLEVFPGWVKPFSNTIGYFITNALGTKETIINIIKKIDDTPDDSLKRALININMNMTKFINEIDIDKHDFIKFIKQLQTEGFTKGKIESDDIFKNSDVIKLYSLVVTKYTIGKLIWYILAGLLISSITYNSIITTSCNKSIDEYKTEYSNIYVNDKKVIYGNVWQKIDISETKNRRYANDTYFKLIRMYSERFNKNNVSFSTDELNRAGIIYEIPNDIYITIKNNNDVYIPTD